MRFRRCWWFFFFSNILYTYQGKRRRRRRSLLKGRRGGGVAGVGCRGGWKEKWEIFVSWLENGERAKWVFQDLGNIGRHRSPMAISWTRHVQIKMHEQMRMNPICRRLRGSIIIGGGDESLLHLDDPNMSDRTSISFSLHSHSLYAYPQSNWIQSKSTNKQTKVAFPQTHEWMNATFHLDSISCGWFMNERIPNQQKNKETRYLKLQAYLRMRSTAF